VESQGSGSLGHAGPLTTFLIVFAGVVTALPLLLFSSAARSIPLTTVGLLQYIAPTLQFLLGVVVYREHFSQDKLIGFGLIWLALLLILGWRSVRSAQSIVFNSRIKSGPVEK
jgi:chloramphenicol-sensitive protein RarD